MSVRHVAGFAYQRGRIHSAYQYRSSLNRLRHQTALVLKHCLVLLWKELTAAYGAGFEHADLASPMRSICSINADASVKRRDDI